MDRWNNRKHEELSYALTQVLTGHGCFRQYLLRFKRTESELYFHCEAVDDARHTLFYCPRWANMRAGMAIAAGVQLTPDNFVDVLVESEKWISWQAWRR